MGSEGSCLAVHKRITYKSGSVHMEPVSVVPWAQADILRKLQALQSLLAAWHQMSLTPTMTMVESLPPVLHPHRTFQFHHRHCCLMSSSCSVGRLSAMWLTADKNSYRLHTPAANLSMEVVLMHLSFSIVAFFARRIWRPRVNLLQSPTVSFFSYCTESTDDCYMHT